MSRGPVPSKTRGQIPDAKSRVSASGTGPKPLRSGSGFGSNQNIHCKGVVLTINNSSLAGKSIPLTFACF